MKIHAICLLCLSIFLGACQQTNGIDNTKSNEIETNQNINIIENTEIKKSEPLMENNKEIFYLTRSDIVEMPKHLEELRDGMDLIIHHHCLSLKSRDGENKIFTFVLNSHDEILFDENKKIIGLMNPKSKKKILIGERVGLGGLTTRPAAVSKKPVPKECSQTLLFTGEIL